mgnify:CR=1 FL=1
MMQVITIVLQILVVLCEVFIYFILIDRRQKINSISVKIKTIAVLLCTALSVTNLGRNLFFILAFIIIGAIALSSKNKNQQNV